MVRIRQVRMHRYSLRVALASPLAALAACVPLSGRAVAATSDETTAIGTDAYINYGYPLVTMEMTRRVSTNVATPSQTGTRAPMGQFALLRSYPNASYKDVVAPNADTLYSVAWIDVRL